MYLSNNIVFAKGDALVFQFDEDAKIDVAEIFTIGEFNETSNLAFEIDEEEKQVIAFVNPTKQKLTLGNHTVRIRFKDANGRYKGWQVKQFRFMVGGTYYKIGRQYDERGIPLDNFR